MDAFALMHELGPWVGVAGSLALALRSHGSSKQAQSEAEKARAEAEKLRASSDAAAVAQLREWIDELKAQVRGLTAKSRRLEREVNDWEARYDELAERAAKREGELQQQIDDLTAQLRELNEERERLQRSIESALPGGAHSSPGLGDVVKVFPGLRRKDGA